MTASDGINYPRLPNAPAQQMNCCQLPAEYLINKAGALHWGKMALARHTFYGGV